jgi:hypothetical protein
MKPVALHQRLQDCQTAEQVETAAAVSLAEDFVSNSNDEAFWDLYRGLIKLSLAKMLRDSAEWAIKDDEWNRKLLP